MPGGDGSGPTRLGPMTGGGFGPCGAGLGRRSVPGGFGGRHGGFGRGATRRNRRTSSAWSGWRHRWWNRDLDPTTADLDREELRQRERALETELAHLRARLAELTGDRRT